MIEIESWMVRTALVIMTLYLVDGALFFLHLWLKRRRRAAPPAAHLLEVSPRKQEDASAFAETLG
jgi:hypothetical protein